MNEYYILYWWLGGLVIGIAGFLFFRFNKNAQVKRVVFPVTIMLTTAAFLGFVWSIADGGGVFIYVFSSIAVVIGFSNWRRTVFCDACGAASYSGSPFKRPAECSSCGSKWV
jgi:hypothetical protein